mmetsp:Transcript_23667/g.47052  ORF Transcript_23667/g.47052 Transcript_23667/m.47052 type:complete len:170 (+) Transcript_23667:312-821(+)
MSSNLTMSDCKRFLLLSSDDTTSKHPSTVSRTTKRSDRLNPENFPALPICLKFLRLAIGLLCGLWMGINDVTGGGALTVGVLVITFGGSIYVEKILKVDEDGARGYGLGTLQFAGAQNGVAAMILAWTTIYTLRHPEMLEGIAEISADLSEASVPPADVAVEAGLGEEF